MNFPVQDDNLRRSLAAFGIKGPIQHDYEATVLPVVLVGDLGQPESQEIGTGLPSGGGFFQVPAGETWKPLYFSAEIAQAAGTVAPRYAMSVLDQIGSIIYIPAIWGQAATNAVDTLTFTAGLNQTTGVVIRFANMLFPAGWQLKVQVQAGDGTISVNNANLICRKIQERLGSQQR